MSLPWCAALSWATLSRSSQTDLYLLEPNLQIHPILTKSHTFILIFNLLTGVSLVLAMHLGAHQAGWFSTNRAATQLAYVSSFITKVFGVLVVAM